jgi:hypothetical protein
LAVTAGYILTRRIIAANNDTAGTIADHFFKIAKIPLPDYFSVSVYSRNMIGKLDLIL